MATEFEAYLPESKCIFFDHYMKKPSSKPGGGKFFYFFVIIFAKPFKTPNKTLYIHMKNTFTHFKNIRVRRKEAQ